VALPFTGVHFHQQHSDTADVPIITLTVAALLLVPPTGGARVVTLLLPELGVKQERHVGEYTVQGSCIVGTMLSHDRVNS
jgi:hypothetical protein